MGFCPPPCPGTGDLLTFQVLPQSVDTFLGQKPSIVLFRVPYARILLSSSKTKVAWSPNIRPPVSYQVVPLFPGGAVIPAGPES
jgi:hypothetical protein